jgi:hypothetical protein
MLRTSVLGEPEPHVNGQGKCDLHKTDVQPTSGEIRPSEAVFYKMIPACPRIAEMEFR